MNNSDSKRKDLKKVYKRILHLYIMVFILVVLVCIGSESGSVAKVMVGLTPFLLSLLVWFLIGLHKSRNAEIWLAALIVVAVGVIYIPSPFSHAYGRLWLKITGGN